MSISLCCNVYQDALALRGLLEISQRYFDNLFIVHSGPGGVHSTDGTIELCYQFGATVVFDDIQRGFGAIRTRLLHECGCDWGMILDADERFWPQIPIMTCEGTEKYPEQQDPNLIVTHHKEIIDQGGQLKNLIQDPNINAIRSTRRHWMDFSMRKAAQNFQRIQDHQLRIVRNSPHIGYERGRVMHERLLDDRTGQTPTYRDQDPVGGPHHDHYHVALRKMQPGKKEFNETNYGRLERGEKMIV